MKNELARLANGNFLALILDNEVTVGEFVASPPLPWTRLVQQDGEFKVADGYPARLTAEQAKFEMRNWDEVSLPALGRALEKLDETVDYVVFGNNAGQGLPLAERLPNAMVLNRAAIIYARTLPERDAYARLGYRDFLRRGDLVAHMLALAARAGRPLALSFINTIQHNELNYHDP